MDRKVIHAHICPEYLDVLQLKIKYLRNPQSHSDNVVNKILGCCHWEITKSWCN